MNNNSLYVYGSDYYTHNIWFNISYYQINHFE